MHLLFGFYCVMGKADFVNRCHRGWYTCLSDGQYNKHVHVCVFFSSYSAGQDNIHGTDTFSSKQILKFVATMWFLADPRIFISMKPAVMICLLVFYCFGNLKYVFVACKFVSNIVAAVLSDGL